MTYDADFLAKLRQREPATCTRFVFAFTPILEAKLRYKFRDRGTIEDLRNETFYRVLIQVDKNGVRDPAQFGSFVRGVCENVAREHIRRTASTASWPDGFEPPDRVLSIDELVADKELKELLRIELRKLTHEEETLITEYFQDKDRRGLARDRGITMSGLNVKLHRALQHLIREFRKNQI
jgi:DNA-directed RNA polymerase specialized sigma24 family protein